MTDVDLEAKVSAEGRIVIPAHVRRALSIQPGDTVRFVEKENGEVIITTGHALMAAVWANNSGRQSVDSAAAVRAQRTEDEAAMAAGLHREAERLRQPWDERRETARLLSAVGLQP